MSGSPSESLLDRVRQSLDGWRADLRLALRSLKRSPILSLAAALTLALGIGVNTAMFGVIDALFFRPPAHVAEPDRVMWLHASPGSVRSWPRYAQFRDNARSMDIAAYYGPRPLGLGQGSTARSVQATIVSGDFFSLTGVAPRLGRLFTLEEAAPASGAAVVVVSEEFWRHELGGRTDALGTSLLLGQRSFTVIGVLPAGYNGVGLTRTDIWLPIGVAAPSMLWKDVMACEACSWLQPIVRLHRGVSAEAATAEATALFRAHRVQRSDTATTIQLGPLNEPVGVDATRGVQLSTWLAAACAIVLLVASVNVANLLLARAAHRQREMAVRLALGSSRGHLIRQLYLESALLALLGGCGALLAAIWTGPLLRSLLLPTMAPVPIDLRLLAFTSGVVLLTMLLAGLAPAVVGTRPDLTAALKTGGREGNVSRSALQSVLLAGQIALTVVLLTGAGLFARSLGHFRSLDLGLDPEHVIIASPHLESVRPTTGDIDAEFGRIRDQVARVPGVTAVALSIGSPFRYSIGVGYVGQGVDSMPDMDGPYLSAVEPDYFAALGTSLLKGRLFTPADIAGSPRVLIVSQSFAAKVYPGRNPIGQCLSLAVRTAPCREIVGIVEDSRQDRITKPSGQTFVPLAQADDPSLALPYTSIMIHTGDKAERLLGAVQRAVQGTAPDLPFVQLEPMLAIMADQIRPWQLGATLFGAFGALALLLGAVGVYGVLSYLISQRTHELGIRSALGAQRHDLLALVVGRGLRVTAIGIAIGGVGALLAGRAVAALMFGVSPYDPLTLAGVVVVLMMVSLGASLIPAWRAARIDPMVALRQE